MPKKSLSLMMAHHLEVHNNVAAEIGIVEPMDRPWIKFDFHDDPFLCDSEQCIKAGIRLRPVATTFRGCDGRPDRGAMLAQCPRCETIYYQMAKGF